jgi:uncharacterized protein
LLTILRLGLTVRALPHSPARTIGPYAKSEEVLDGMTSPRTLDKLPPEPEPSATRELVRTVAADRTRLETLPFADKPTTLTAGQRERSAVVWTGGDEGLRVGLWECERGAFTAVRDAVHEVCYVLSGRATLWDAAGDAAEVSAGTLLVLPDGWDGTWEVHEPIEKVFVVIPS